MVTLKNCVDEKKRRKTEETETKKSYIKEERKTVDFGMQLRKQIFDSMLP